jgi:formate C-acetyltransferase
MKEPIREGDTMVIKTEVKGKITSIKPRYLLPGEEFTVVEPVAPQLREVKLEGIEELGCSLRVKRLRKTFFLNRPTICIHRARVYTRVYKETEGEPTVLRRGKSFKRYCEQKPIIIQDDELIVGSAGCRPRYVLVCPDYSWEWVMEELDKISSRPQDPYLLSEEQKTELREEIIPYWKGKSLHEYVVGHLPSDTKKLVYGTNFAGDIQKSLRGLGHNAAGIRRLIAIGFKGVEELARQNLSKLSYANPSDHEKIYFLEAVIDCCQGMKIFGERHAAEARKLAVVEKSVERKKELLQIAEICDWVPYNPARTFWEAAQAAWFVQIGTKMVQSSTSFGLGRFDQYMLPFFEKDLREGKLSKEKAQELIECLWIKNGEVIPVAPEKTAKYVAGYASFQDVTVGGLTREGKDATNELSYMCMQATYDLRMTSPSLAVRIHRNCPEKFLVKAAEVIRTGCGMPQCHNDDIGIRMMLAAGTTMEDARDYEIRGCSESMVGGKMWKYSDAGPLSLGACLEWALNDGYSRVVKGNGRWGLPTGDPRKFRSFEEIEEAFKKQIAYLTQHECIAAMIVEQAQATVVPEPYVSSLMEGCVEKGMDYLKGGALYNVGPAPEYTGLADVSNSLAAIKKFVFQEKVITLGELLDALDRNFEGTEEMRQMLLNRGPKYGWDDKYVDEIATRIADFCAEEPTQYVSPRGCHFISGLYPVSGNVPLGLAVGALPSGRKAGMPLAEGISPMQGTDRVPTEVIKSVTSFDHARHQDGGMLNMKFNPAVLADERGLKNFASLLRTYCDLGGWHIQFNAISATTLKDAQKHPEKYPSLMIRVAGYSAYFTDLCREVQNDVISRIEHTSW